MGDLGDVQHAAAEKRDFAAVFIRQIENLLKPMNGTAEAGDDQPALTADEQLFKTGPHRPLAFRIAGPIHIGRIRHQQQDAAFAVFGERVEIE